MVRLGCVPEQGGPSAYMENAKAVGRRRRGARSKQMVWVKMVPKQRPSEAMTVPAGIRLCGAGQRARTIGESRLSECWNS